MARYVTFRYSLECLRFPTLGLTRAALPLRRLGQARLTTITRRGAAKNNLIRNH